MITATIVGNLVTDPETEQRGGHAITKFRIASNRGKDKPATFVSVSLFGARGEAFARHHRKGGKAALSGALYVDEWTGKDGNARQTVCLDAREWEFTGSKADSKPQGSSNQGGGYSAPDDSVPF